MYVKIFSQIFDSTIAEDPDVRHIFMDFLVLADDEGRVDMTLESVARRINVPLERVARAVQALTAPDPRSRSKEHGGARLVLIDPERDWGWRVVNYAAYRNIRHEDDRREYMRIYMSDYRSKKKAADVNNVNNVNTDVNNVNTSKPRQRQRQRQRKEAEKKKDIPLPQTAAGQMEGGKQGDDERNGNGSERVCRKQEPSVNGWAVWVDVWRELRPGVPDPMPVGPDVKAAQQLLRMLRDGNRLRAVYARFLRDDDDFLYRQGYALRLLSGRVNRYLAEMEAEAMAARPVRSVMPPPAAEGGGITPPDGVADANEVQAMIDRIGLVDDVEGQLRRYGNA